MDKYDALIEYIKNLKSVCVAYSSGVDSTLLLYAAKEALGERVIAVTARSCSFPNRELQEAATFCEERDIAHVIVDSEELEIDGFSHNPKNRCYLCKSELFTKIRAVAAQNGMANVCEGSNTDDVGDYRPGRVAIAEQGILSPLLAVGLSKTEIREISFEKGLGTWDKQSFACLASRFPYGDEITKEKLAMIDKAEQYLIDKGFKQVRVRIHGSAARIETDDCGFRLLTDEKLREETNAALRAAGFAYVALDLRGYRTGSMNETL